MPVHSEPISSRGRSQSPQVIPRAAVIRATIGMLRFIAVLLLVASTFGNYVQFAGGWEQYLPANAVVIGLAVAYQIICSIFQWGFKALRWWALYALALIASAIPSFLTYNTWAGPYLATQIGSALAVVVIGLATIGADALPEWVLIG